MAPREVFVCVKQAVAVTGPLAFAPGGGRLAPECRQWVHHEADGYALELALRLREQGAVERITCITAGPAEAAGMLGWCLAMGADRAVRIPVAEDAGLDQLGTGTLLGAAIRRLGGRLVLAAQRSDDGQSGLVPAAVARALDAPYLSNVALVRLSEERVEVQRKLERGNRQIWAASLPAVIGVEPGSVLPRYVSVAAIILARRRAVEELTPAALGADPQALPRLATLQRLVAPRVRPKKMAASMPGQSVSDRRKIMMSGGLSDKKEKRVLNGSPEQLATEVVNLLRERQILTRDGG